MQYTPKKIVNVTRAIFTARRCASAVFAEALSFHLTASVCVCLCWHGLWSQILFCSDCSYFVVTVHNEWTEHRTGKS